MELKEAIEILEAAVKDDLKPYSQKAAKDQMNKLGLSLDSYFKRVSPKRDYKEFKQHKHEKGQELLADVRGEELPHLSAREKHKHDIRKIIKKYNLGGDSTAAKSILRHNKKMNKNEALSILEEMLSVANSIFERSLLEANPEAPTAEEVPPSNNKIKQTKKDKETNKKTEVVSVADELFPYEGNAKQQMNQKILAKINDMIEGTATLEDLLQLVRRGKRPVSVKESFDILERKLYNEKKELALLEDVINELKDSTLRAALTKAKNIKAEQEKVKDNDNVDKEFTKDQIAKREHQANNIEDYYEGQVAKRVENEQKSKKKKRKRS